MSKTKKKKMEEDERWHGGLSDCCDAPIKEIGTGLAILICSDCGQMCNEKRDNDDDEYFIPEDWED